MSDQALGMLRHMRKQIWMQGTRDVSVPGAARSVGVQPEGREFAVLVEELLQGGYIEAYDSPSLTEHGLYRLNDSGITAVDQSESGP